MQRKAYVMSAICGLSVSLSLAAAASATTGVTDASKRYYWTTTHAVAAAKTVKVPYCRVYPTATGCATHAGVPIAEASCVGSVPLRGKFNRFVCQYTLLNDLGSGRLAIYVAGVRAFRWKVL